MSLNTGRCYYYLMSPPGHGKAGLGATETGARKHMGMPSSLGASSRGFKGETQGPERGSSEIYDPRLREFVFRVIFAALLIALV